jgi:quinohemoprotein ethanol dehydrogenase
VETGTTRTSRHVRFLAAVGVKADVGRAGLEQCSRCHVFGPSVTPDLRKIPTGIHAQFKNIVLKGALAPLGMESFDDILSEADVDAIHAYVIDQAWKGYNEQEKSKAK